MNYLVGRRSFFRRRVIPQAEQNALRAKMRAEGNGSWKNVPRHQMISQKRVRGEFMSTEDVWGPGIPRVGRGFGSAEVPNSRVPQSYEMLSYYGVVFALRES